MKKFSVTSKTLMLAGTIITGTAIVAITTYHIVKKMLNFSNLFTFEDI